MPEPRENSESLCPRLRVYDPVIKTDADMKVLCICFCNGERRLFLKIIGDELEQSRVVF